MAEYINRQDLDFLNDFCIDSGKYVGLRLDDVFNELATADVIERAKINKAKKQITDSMNEHLASDGTPIDEYAYCYLNVLEILEENIGE